MTEQDEFKFVSGLSAKNAQALLGAADDLELDAGVVRTLSDGFEVPIDVFDKAADNLDVDQIEDAEDESLSFNSKAEAEAHADANGLDVDKSLHAQEYKDAVVAADAEKKG